MPGYGLFVGPRIWKGLTMGFDMFWGPLSGPSVPNPRFTWIKAVKWPRNHPGWKATVPPDVGQYVRFFVVPMPPPV